jgi:putative oxidoreductase
MKIASTIARVLLGLTFVTFGLNGFLNFIHMPPPTGLAGQFLGVLFVSHYTVPIFAFQLVGGALLLANRFVPLALAILAPVIVNILIFHCLMAPEGLPLALIATLLWAVVFIGKRSAFAGLFVARA